MPRSTDESEALAQFGRRIAALRAARRMSQERLAELAGLHRTYIGTIERGEPNLALLNVISLADALDVDPGELVRDLRT
jgi:transcriptional regulator with XRE-family HTH domain